VNGACERAHDAGEPPDALKWRSHAVCVCVCVCPCLVSATNVMASGRSSGGSVSYEPQVRVVDALPGPRTPLNGAMCVCVCVRVISGTNAAPASQAQCLVNRRCVWSMPVHRTPLNGVIRVCACACVQAYFGNECQRHRGSHSVQCLRTAGACGRCHRPSRLTPLNGAHVCVRAGVSQVISRQRTRRSKAFILVVQWASANCRRVVDATSGRIFKWRIITCVCRQVRVRPAVLIPGPTNAAWHRSSLSWWSSVR
jgi:hypothetical protein